MCVTPAPPPPSGSYLMPIDRQVVYHGPILDVVPFFNELGFAVPPRKDVPSFLQEVTTPMGERLLLRVHGSEF